MGTYYNYEEMVYFIYKFYNEWVNRMKRIIYLIACVFCSANVNAAITGDAQEIAGSYNLSTGGGSGTPAESPSTYGGDAVSDSAIEAFLGLSAGTLDGLAATRFTSAVEGSAASDTFTISAGEVFTFDWSWTSDEGIDPAFPSEPPVFDFAFVSVMLNGVSEDISIFANAVDTPDGATGTFSWQAYEGGSLDIGIGVVDGHDAEVNSYLSAFNFNVTPGPDADGDGIADFIDPCPGDRTNSCTAGSGSGGSGATSVPEASSLYLLAFGLLGLLGAARRKV